MKAASSSVRCFRNIAQMLDHYSSFNPSPLSIKQFIDFGEHASERQSFRFLRAELPVRLANIMREIQLLPSALLLQPSCGRVAEMYHHSFSEVIEFEKADPDSSAVLDEFCETLVRVRNRHSQVVQSMAEGVVEMKQAGAVDASTEHNVQYFLDRFYMSRIGIRMLINQHSLLFSQQGAGSGNPRHVGCIDPYCNVLDVIADADADARRLCDRYYRASPQLQIQQVHEDTSGFQKRKNAHLGPVQLMYVPSHLYHMLFELLKNAMRAVVERHGSEPPPLQVLVCSGGEDLTVKISDQGGGVSRSASEHLFKYMYSTAPRPPQEPDAPPLAGYGYGLPLSRLYARYFQGDIIVNSCEGYGTDAIIYLKTLAKDASEVLPIFNKSSERQYRGSQEVSDWSSQIPSSRYNHR